MSAIQYIDYSYPLLKKWKGLFSLVLTLVLRIDFFRNAEAWNCDDPGEVPNAVRYFGDYYFPHLKNITYKCISSVCYTGGGNITYLYGKWTPLPSCTRMSSNLFT